MKLKHLESALSQMDYRFIEPQIRLEQYPTSPHLAAAVALAARDRGDLGDGVTACDLGCGTGMLTAAAALMGCSQVLALDCDPAALRQAQRNVQEIDMEIEHVVDFVQAEVQYAGSPTSTEYNRGRGKGRGGARRKERGCVSNARTKPRDFSDKNYGGGIANTSGVAGTDGIPLSSKCVDTVLINPPFGTKQNAGVDVAFLAVGCRLARRAVYSFHKTSTRKYLLSKATSDWSMGAEVVAEMKFDIPNMYKFHKKQAVDIEVDLLRVWHLDTEISCEEEDDQVNEEAVLKANFD